MESKSCNSVVEPNLFTYLAWLRRSGEGELKWGGSAGGDEKGRGVVARQVRGEKVFDWSLLSLLIRLSKGFKEHYMY